MEKPSKHEATPKRRRGGGGTVSEDRRPHTSSPRSKVKNPQEGSSERRYKEMLHTTSHIYQTQATSGMTDAPEESCVPNKVPQPHSKDTIPVREKRSFSTGSILPEGITTDVPLTEIMSREKPTSTVINSEISQNPDSEKGKSPNSEDGKNPNPSEKSTKDSAQQTSVENGVVNHRDQNDCFARESTCRKHSSENTDGKQKSLISRPKLCESCTVSMLSYIAMLRDMLDEVTSEITNPEDQSVQCAKCVKERVMQRNQLTTSTERTSTADETVYLRKDASQRPHDLPLKKQTAEYPLSEHKPSDGEPSYQQRDKFVGLQQQRTLVLPVEEFDSSHKDSRTASASYENTQDFPTSRQRVPENATDFPTSAQHVSNTTFAQSQSGDTGLQRDNGERTEFSGTETSTSVDQTGSATLLDMFSEERSQQQRSGAQFDTNGLPRKQPIGGESRLMDHSETPSYISNQNGAFFGDTFRSTDETSTDVTDQRFLWQQDRVDDHDRKMPKVSAPEDFHSQTSPFLRDREETDGILSALSNEEREVYDSARGGAGWERLADTQDYRDTSFGPNSTEEAFVTMATTNAEAISSLVLGSSLLLCRTTRTLCVLVTDGVSPSLRAPLASVFQVVQSVRSLDTVGTTKVALLDQPELGIFFRKLHVWRLVQFPKCVFLNPDTLVRSTGNTDRTLFPACVISTNGKKIFQSSGKAFSRIQHTLRVTDSPWSTPVIWENGRNESCEEVQIDYVDFLLAWPEDLSYSVIQNSDELFCHDELSAVPDIGWPDCFNSGVFVFQPSVETFWKLVEFAESEGSYDGGDQGLLNAFFKNWSKDIHKKLSFIYNLMANVSYTYTPAFKQFGRNVKIVQFQGAFKPWHVKFYTGTGQIAPSTAVHPTYVQFVHVWLNIFRVRVLPLFSQDIQSFASSQNIISASQLLKFYPSPIEADPDFLLTPPSVRIRPDPLGTPKQPSIIRRHSIGSPKELKQATSESECPKEHITHEKPPLSRDKEDELTPPNHSASKYKDEDNPETEESRPTVDEEGPPQSAAEQLTSVPQELKTTETDTPVETTADDSDHGLSIPGSEIGDYHGMVAWEQGRMDYMGSACSENIIKRLHFLMDKPNDHEKPE